MNKIFLIALYLSAFIAFADDIYPPLPPISSSEVTITGTVSVAGTVDSNVITSVLPTGAATETKQDTGNSSLTNIDSDTSAISGSASSMDGKLTTTNSNLATIENNTDGIESELSNLLTELQQKTEPTDTQPVSGSLGRTWTLSSGTDSVSASVSNFPALTDVNLTQILGAAPSVTNWMPARISNGVSYVDPTQIRALTSLDQVTVANASLAVTQVTSPWVTSRNWTLSSGTDSVVANQGGAWTVTANAGTNLNTSALALATTQTDRSQFTRITDGTRDGSLKAASTAALAADTSLVVALSPNSPLPTGSNVIGALSANQSVNLTQLSGVAPSATNPIPTRMSDGVGFISSTVNGGQRYINNALIQNITVSANNNSTANLAASATFTGTAESNLGIAAVQINFKADQAATIQLQQSPDGTNWDYVDSYVVPANFGDARVIQAMGSFFRVLVTNSGTSATTFLRLQTILAPIMDAIPRSLGPKSESASLSVVQSENKTFTVNALNTAIGNNKSMLAIFNAANSTSVVKINSVKIINAQTTGVTGIVSDFRLRRITALSAGTALTPRSFDTLDTLSSFVTAVTGGTATDAAGPIDYERYQWSSDEWGPGTLDTEGSDHAMQNLHPAYQNRAGEKPITLRASEGLSVTHVFNSTAGTFDIVINFSVDQN